MTPGRTHKEWYQENRERILIKIKIKLKQMKENNMR
jgi:hypothetical protein